MKRNGFLLGEHLIALGILITGITFFILTAQSILSQNTKMEEQLVAARLCKESLSTGMIARETGYQLNIKRDRMTVVKHRRIILEIVKC